MTSPVKVLITLVTLVVIASGILQLLDVAPTRIESVRFSLGMFFLIVWLGYAVLYRFSSTLHRRLLRLKNNLRYRTHSFLRPAGIHLRTTVLGLSAYQHQIEEEIRTSAKIYFLLVSAQTRLFDPKELFIYAALQNLTVRALGIKDIRFKLADPTGEAFERRAEWLVQEMRKRMEPWAVHDSGEYRTRCASIAEELRAITPQVDHYRREPLWRLLIFDESMYVATYREPNGQRRQGQLTWVSHIPGTSATYEGLLGHFLQVGTAQTTLVVSPDQPEVFETLSRALAKTDTVRLMVDRRSGKPFRPRDGQLIERRQLDLSRELASRGWGVAPISGIT